MEINAYQYLDNADKLQTLFDEHQIPIDLHTGDGLNAMIRADAMHAEYPNTFAYTEANIADDMTDTNLAISGVGGRRAYVFKPGEDSPRCVYQDWDGSYALSEPVDTIQEPKRPGFFTRLMNRIFGYRQDVIDRYDRQMNLYNMTASARTDSFKKAVEAHKTDAKRMYTADRKALEDQFRARNAAGEKRSAEKSLTERAKVERDGLYSVLNSMDKKSVDFNKLEFRKQLAAIASSDPTEPDPVRSFLFRMDPEQLKSMENGFTTFHNLRNMVEQTIEKQQSMGQPRAQQPQVQQQAAQQEMGAFVSGNP